MGDLILLRQETSPFSYAVALLASLVAVWLSLLLSPYLHQSPFLFSILAVLVSAWYGGRGAGLLATTFGALAALYLIYAHLNAPTITVIEDLLWFGLSVLVMFVISTLNLVRRRGEEALLRLAAVFESSDDAIIGEALDGTILSWNAGAQRVYGYAADEVIGRQSGILVPPERLDEAAERLGQIQRGEPSLRYEAVHRRKDGQPVDIGLSVSRIKDATGRPIGISTVRRDITESKRAQAERDRLLERAQTARQQAEASAERLKAIQMVTDAALGHLPLDALLLELLSRIRAALAADNATILLLTADGQSFEVRAAVGLDEQASESVQIPVGDGLATQIVTPDKPLVIEDLSTLERRSPFLRQETGSLIAVPLHVQDRVVGVAYVGTLQRHHFTEADVQLLQVVADRAASAIERARLFDQVSAGSERLKLLSQRLMEANEVERRSIAAELHDEIGQALTAVKLNLQATQRGLASIEPERRADGRAAARSPVRLLDESIALIERTLQQVRDLSLDLRPSVLDDLGLEAALRWYVDRLAQRTGVEAEFVADPLEERLAPKVEIACFRVAQEALTNVTRHAHSQSLRVELRRLPDAINLLVHDDGIGFDVDAALARATQGHSMGLLGMQERVQAAGGVLEITSASARGTQVRARFPLSEIPVREGG